MSSPPKSSAQNPENTTPDCIGNNSNESNDLICLRSQLEDLELKIATYNDVSLESVDSYLDLIHQYNEIKDTGQTLIGHLARLQGVSTKEIYKEQFPGIEDIGNS